MQIYIRTQNKKSVMEVHNYGACTIDGKHYVACDLDDTTFTFGEYSTIERCVEIVNSIYNEMISRATDGDSVVIYSMPKE